MRGPNDSARDGMTATVIAGTSSVDAKLDDLRATSAVLRTTGTMLNTIASSVADVHLVLQAGGDAQSPLSARVCVSAAAALHGQLLNAGAQADGLACAMDLTVTTYELAELTSAGLFGDHRPLSPEFSWWSTAWDLRRPESQASGTASLITWLDKVLPGSYENTVAALDTVARAVYDPRVEAHTRLVAEPGQRRSPAAATSIATSMKQVEVMYRDDKDTSHIQVQRVVDPGTGQGHWIAMLPGTSGWDNQHHSTLTGTDNLIAMTGRPGEAEKAVTFALEDAMRREGVLDKHEPVMLVGHSQGGIVMTSLARNSVGSKLNVKRVVTYGSPVGRMKVPPGVRSLNIENTRDLVPALDGWATGDGDNRRTRVVIDDPASVYDSAGRKNVINAHDPGQYRRDYQTAVERDQKNANSGITRFENESKVFFEGQAHTYQYDATRAVTECPADTPSHSPTKAAPPATGSTEGRGALRPPGLINPSTGGYVVTGR